MPENILQIYRKRIPSQWKVCFFCALLTGFFAHFYKITNWLPNWDSLVFRYDAQNMIGLGRWFLPVACGFSSFYDLPWLNGILAILFHGLGAVCICQALQVKRGITAGLIGAVVASFPTVTSVMMYNYVADGYGMAFFFACLAAVCLTKEKPKLIAASLLITLSVAIYQAYLTVTVMVLLVCLIEEAICRQTEAKLLLKKSLQCFAAGLIGVVLYALVLTAILKLSGGALLEYQGMDSAFSLEQLNLWATVYQVIWLFFGYFFDGSRGISFFYIGNAIMLGLGILGYGIAAVKHKVFFSLGRSLLLLLFVCLLPFGAVLLSVINPGVDYHNLMKMGYCFFYILFLLLYEHGDYGIKRYSTVKAWTVFLLGCFLVVNQVVIANVSYHKSQMAYEKSYGVLLRIADRIEQIPASSQCDELLVIGALPGSEAYSAVVPPDMTGITDSYILRADDEIVGQSVLCSALNDYCGKEYRFLSGDRKQEFLKREAIREMSCWPEAGSVCVTDGVIVVKLGAESEVGK